MIFFLCRRRRLASYLVICAINVMKAGGCAEVVLETEECNKAALSLYEKLGFVKDKRLVKYYLNGGDAYRVFCWLK